MIPADLTSLEILDLAIRYAQYMRDVYDAFGRRTKGVARLNVKFAALKKDKVDHYKTLRAHRRDLYGHADRVVGEKEFAGAFVLVDFPPERGRDELISALSLAIRAEESAAHFYERTGDRLLDYSVRVFFEVLESEAEFHIQILRGQLELAEAMDSLPSPKSSRLIST